MKDIPFEIKRIFYIYGSDSSVVRGQHANIRKNTGTKSVLYLLNTFISTSLLLNAAPNKKIQVKDSNAYIILLDRRETDVKIYRSVHA